MKCPNERLAILNRIKAACICMYMDKHYSYDWEECISSMVKKGQLTPDGKGGYSLV